MMELRFLKELMLIRQANQKNVMLLVLVFKTLNFNEMSA